MSKRFQKTNVRKNVRTGKNDEQYHDKDIDEIVLAKKKYSFKYIMHVVLFEFNFIFLMFLLLAIAVGKFGYAFDVILVYLILLFACLYTIRDSAKRTYISFRPEGIKYRDKFLFRDKTEKIEYNEVKEIKLINENNLYYKYWQKKLDIGQIMVIFKNGNVVFGNITIKYIGNFKEVKKILEENFGEKINNG